MALLYVLAGALIIISVTAGYLAGHKAGTQDERKRILKRLSSANVTPQTAVYIIRALDPDSNE